MIQLETTFHVYALHLIYCCQNGLGLLVAQHLNSAKLDVTWYCHEERYVIYKHDVPPAT
jgi:hypothetical protein